MATELSADIPTAVVRADWSYFQYKNDCLRVWASFAHICVEVSVCAGEKQVKGSGISGRMYENTESKSGSANPGSEQLVRLQFWDQGVKRSGAGEDGNVSKLDYCPYLATVHAWRLEMLTSSLFASSHTTNRLALSRALCGGQSITLLNYLLG